MPVTPKPPARRRTAAKPRGATQKPVTGMLDQAVYDGLFDAVMHGRLKPGARLGELQLCEQFQVSRTVVRQALRRLAEASIVEIVPNKGATVAAPSPQETREVFAARRAIEGAIVRAAAERIAHGDVLRLKQRMLAEHAAAHAADHTRWVALAGGFHLALAEIAGNRVLQRLLAELMTRCSLIVALYETPGESSCEHAEHDELVELLSLRDGPAAAAVMERHLLGLEARLRLPSPPTGA